MFVEYSSNNVINATTIIILNYSAYNTHYESCHVHSELSRSGAKCKIYGY